MSAITKKIVSHLPLMEAFYTIQGEGYHQGKAAYFIRLAGCDVGCVWCDVKDSWDAGQYPEVAVPEIVKAANAFPSRIAVITGGEPLMYDLSYLTESLKTAGFSTHVETSGAHPLTGTWDWICFSPKKFKAPDENFCSSADELKVIIYHPSDFDFAEQYASKVSKHCKLYLQPEWDRRNTMTPKVIEYVKQNPKWEISLQVHKFMDIP